MVARPRDRAWQGGPGLSRSTPMPLPERFPNPFPPPFAGAWGDDVYGLWADLQVPADGGSRFITQRLRWIEPGSFLMGSPETEAGRMTTKARSTR